jgi:acetyl esterase/lipase
MASRARPKPLSKRKRSPLATAALAVAGLVVARQVGRTLAAQYAMLKTAPDMKRVLDKMAELGIQPVEKLSVEAARRQPTPADAVRAIAGVIPPDGVMVRDVRIRGAASDLPARVYTPQAATADDGGKPPLIVYWHGGGWVIADLDTYDGGARALARETGAVVLSCHYRQAPEHKFPAAHEDALAAYAWAVEHAQELGADGRRVAVAGESAGGNLAANVALAAARTPDHQLLVYPVASANLFSASYLENVRAKPLSKAGMQWFIGHVFASKAEAKDPRIDLVNRDDLAKAPPATIITADIDPLRSDGEALADRLTDAGVPVHYACYPAVTHEFFGMDAAVAAARDAQALAGQELRRAFGDDADMRVENA